MLSMRAFKRKGLFQVFFFSCIKYELLWSYCKIAGLKFCKPLLVLFEHYNLQS